jgi:uncharacterized protein DUF2752
MVTARQRALLWSLGFLGTFPAAFVAKSWIVTTSLIICPFRAITGLPCLFCGLTRAFAYATHGEFAAATESNPLWWLAALLVAAQGAALLSRALGGRPVATIERRHWRPLESTAVVAIVVGGSLLRALAARGW